MINQCTFMKILFEAFDVFAINRFVLFKARLPIERILYIFMQIIKKNINI